MYWKSGIRKISHITIRKKFCLLFHVKRISEFTSPKSEEIFSWQSHACGGFSVFCSRCFGKKQTSSHCAYGKIRIFDIFEDPWMKISSNEKLKILRLLNSFRVWTILESENFLFHSIPKTHTLSPKKVSRFCLVQNRIVPRCSHHLGIFFKARFWKEKELDFSKCFENVD